MTPRIFVALAAYREPELALTIESCLDQARYPERLRFGVCLQWDDTIPDAGPDCVDHLRDRTDLAVLSYPHTVTRGGCWARHLVQGLYQDEEYTLQCDAHSRLRPDWDADLVTTLGELASDKPLLTGFPSLYTRTDGVDDFQGSAEDPVPVTVVEEWVPEGWVHHPTVPAPPGLPLGARRTRVLSGAFVFTLGQWNDEVRQDPEMLYTGEEFALTLRSFTAGYDLWNPSSRVIWHRLHPHTNPKYITDDLDGRQHERHLKSMKRLRTLLTGDPDRILEPYSLGSARSLTDYHLFSGLDCATRNLHPDAVAGIPPDPVTIAVPVPARDTEQIS